jgi:hypothetical protein
MEGGGHTDASQCVARNVCWWQDSTLCLSERRLDEERLQIEAKKREREEQHLYLTAKVCRTNAYGFPFSHKVVRSSPTRLLRNMKASTWPPSMKRTGRHQSCPRSVCSRTRLTARSSHVSRNTLTIPRTKFACGCSLTDRIRLYGQIRIYRRTKQH